MIEVSKKIWHSRPETQEPGYEWIWQRVQRERAEGHPKYRGGRSRQFNLKTPNHRLNDRDIYEMQREGELYGKTKKVLMSPTISSVRLKKTRNGLAWIQLMRESGQELNREQGSPRRGLFRLI